MKKHLLALLSVGSLVAMLPGCNSCCKTEGKEVVTEEVTSSNTEVAANEATVDPVATEVVQDAVASAPVDEAAKH